MSFSVILEDIATEILALKLELSRSLLVIAIEGKGCSGKTSLSSLLKATINQHGCDAAVVSIDDFCNPREVRYDDSVPEGLQVYENNFNIRQLLEQVLIPASINQQLDCSLHTLDVKTDDYTNHIEISLPRGGVLILEGLHILKDSIFKYIDYAVFLWISEKEQLRRALVRDTAARGIPEELVPSKYKNRFIPSYRAYMSIDQPLEKAAKIIITESPQMPRIITKEEFNTFFEQSRDW